VIMMRYNIEKDKLIVEFGNDTFNKEIKTMVITFIDDLLNLQNTYFKDIAINESKPLLIPVEETKLDIDLYAGIEQTDNAYQGIKIMDDDDDEVEDKLPPLTDEYTEKLDLKGD